MSSAPAIRSCEFTEFGVADVGVGAAADDEGRRRRAIEGELAERLLHL